METKRSKYLVHWAGKEIETGDDQLNEKQRTKYANKLSSILHEGFWMTTPKEVVHGHGGSRIGYTAPMTCFTELKLSAAEDHARKYGRLGIGVSRQFVLDRFGGPVHYVRNRQDEAIVGNINQLLRLLITKEDERQVFLKEHHRKSLALIIAFLKPMSTEAEPEDFVLLDELEWRIVHTHQIQEQRLIVETGEPEPKYRIPLKPTDVKFIVFPDDETRVLSYCDSRFGKWIKPLEVPPTMLTLEECSHF